MTTKHFFEISSSVLMGGIMLVVLMIVMSSCHGGDIHEQKYLSVSFEQREMLDGQNEFALDMLRTVCEGKETNVFLSPLSASLVLGMMADGAKEETLEEILSVLHMEEYSQNDLNLLYGELVDKVPYLDTKTDIKLANGLWVGEECQLQSQFAADMKEYYQARVETADLSDGKTAEIINHWVKEQTNGLIDRICDEEYFNEDLRLVIANALYFKGEWKDTFKKVNTKKEDFTLANGQTVQVDMMNQEESMECTPGKGSFDYSTGKTQEEEPDVRMLRKTYEGGSYCMDVLLPREGISVDEMLAELDFEALSDLYQQCRYGSVTLKMPRFKMRYQRVLNNDMKKLGMSSAFSSTNANFSGISEQTDVYLSLLQQDTYVEVDEEGTKAAATTSGWFTDKCEDPSLPEEFIIDRPFVFFIREVRYGTILFAGKIGDPR